MILIVVVAAGPLWFLAAVGEALAPLGPLANRFWGWVNGNGGL